MNAAALVIDEPRGGAETADLSQRCANLWATALGCYYKDAQAVWRGMRNGHDGGAALEDLLGDRRLLANLLAGFGGDMCPQRLGDAMLVALEQGRRFTPSSMTRPVREVAEDYSGLDGWRARKSK